MRNPYLCKYKSADQLHSKCAADLQERLFINGTRLGAMFCPGRFADHLFTLEVVS